MINQTVNCWVMMIGLLDDKSPCMTDDCVVLVIHLDFCLSLDISVVPIPVKTIPELFRRALMRVLPELVDRYNLGLKQWGRSTTSQFQAGDSKAARCGQIGMAATGTATST